MPIQVEDHGTCEAKAGGQENSFSKGGPIPATKDSVKMQGKFQMCEAGTARDTKRQQDVLIMF